MDNSSLNSTAPVLTIDGPSGSGKGTISRIVAQRLAGVIDGPAPSHPLVMPLLTLFLTAASAPSATVQPALCGCRA